MMYTIQEISPDNLVLDKKNPRFGISHAADEAEALEILLDTTDLKELWDSIGERGFERFEPLVATEENGQLVVLEGNRRLAAVKLLLNPSTITREPQRRRIPALSADKLATCATLPVIVLADRKDAQGYIGFKHVNGPARWSSLAKAKFGVDFFESIGGSMTPQERMQSLTKQLGDSRGLIIRLLVAYKIIQQSISLGHFDKLAIDESSFEFSHLYTLINNPDSREFIGLSRAPLSETMIVDRPVPATHYEALLELLGWLYGPKSVIASQGTDRPRLQRVLGNEEAIHELRITGDLSSAETIAGLRNEDWINLLAKAAAFTQKAAGDAALVLSEISPEDIESAKKLLARIQIQIRQITSALPESEGK